MPLDNEKIPCREIPSSLFNGAKTWTSLIFELTKFSTDHSLLLTKCLMKFPSNSHVLVTNFHVVNKVGYLQVTTDYIAFFVLNFCNGQLIAIWLLCCFFLTVDCLDGTFHGG